MGVLYDWYITTGNAGRLCVLPERMMKNRESLRHIKCTGIVDAVKQLKNYDCDDPYGTSGKVAAALCARIACGAIAGAYQSRKRREALRQIETALLDR